MKKHTFNTYSHAKTYNGTFCLTHIFFIGGFVFYIFNLLHVFALILLEDLLIQNILTTFSRVKFYYNVRLSHYNLQVSNFIGRIDAWIIRHYYLISYLNCLFLETLQIGLYTERKKMSTMYIIKIQITFL